MPHIQAATLPAPALLAECNFKCTGRHSDDAEGDCAGNVTFVDDPRGRAR